METSRPTRQEYLFEVRTGKDLAHVEVARFPADSPEQAMHRFERMRLVGRYIGEAPAELAVLDSKTGKPRASKVSAFAEHVKFNHGVKKFN